MRVRKKITEIGERFPTDKPTYTTEASRSSTPSADATPAMTPKRPVSGTEKPGPDKKRQKYTNEFKREVLEYLDEVDSRSIGDVAAHFSLRYETVRGFNRWRSKLKYNSSFLKNRDPKYAPLEEDVMQFVNLVRANSYRGTYHC